MSYTDYYLKILEDEFCRRQRANRSYSLRAYAKFLGIDSSTLSSVLRKKRAFPLKKADTTCVKLGLSPKEKEKFLESIRLQRSSLAALAQVKASTDNQTLTDEDHFKIIAEWEHYAVLSLLKCKKKETTLSWFSSRLGLSELRLKNVLNRLEQAKLVKRDPKGHYTRICKDLVTSEDTLSLALQKSHQEALEMGLEKLRDIAPSDRDYSSMTLLLDKKGLCEAKVLIREFRTKMAKLLEDQNAQEVYQLCLQLYPLTQLEKDI